MGLVVGIKAGSTKLGDAFVEWRADMFSGVLSVHFQQWLVCQLALWTFLCEHFLLSVMGISFTWEDLLCCFVRYNWSKRHRLAGLQSGHVSPYLHHVWIFYTYCMYVYDTYIEGDACASATAETDSKLPWPDRFQSRARGAYRFAQGSLYIYMHI